MSLGGSFAKMPVLFVVLAFVVTPAIAFARPDRPRDGTPRSSNDDDAQMRETLAKLSAASGHPAAAQRSEAELMYEAMRRWNGETPNSAAIDRLVEQSKKDAARTKRATVDKMRRMFWRDPFADEGQRLVLVRQADRDLVNSYERKDTRKQSLLPRDPTEARELTFARLRAQLAAVRAENARLRQRARTIAERQSCSADLTATGEIRKGRRAPEMSAHRPERPARMATPTPTPTPTPTSDPMLPSAATLSRPLQLTATPPAAPSEAPPPPARGIIVVPISRTAPPPVADAGRRKGGIQ